MRRRVSFKTLGCRLNQAETEAVATELLRLGWNIVEFGLPADVVIVNSCTVTNSADRKSRSVMKQALSAVDAPHEGFVVMTGCYVEEHRRRIAADACTYYVDNGHKYLIPQLIDAHFQGEPPPECIESNRDPFGFSTAESVFRTRALVKIQDGCDHFCSYCVIPFVRGRAVSRNFDDILKSVVEALNSGYREIVLTGVNMGRWQEGSRDFVQLVAAILSLEGDFRLRLGSIEPDHSIHQLVDLMSHPKMTSHLHLCLQSGSERMLRAMRRQYTAAYFETLVGEFRMRMPQFNLTTDVIVGFPGETGTDFRDTLELSRRIGFGHIHVFPYSRRDGTKAGDWECQVDEGVKKARCALLRQLSLESQKSFRESLIGTSQKVLVESVEQRVDASPRARGFSLPYVPVIFDIPSSYRVDQAKNRFWDVRIERLAMGDNPDLIGTPMSGYVHR